MPLIYIIIRLSTHIRCIWHTTVDKILHFSTFHSMLFLPFIFLLLVACSDNLLHSETKSLSIEHISIEVQNKSYTVLTDYSLSYSYTVLVGDTIFFYAKINPPDAEVCYWLIESVKYPCLQQVRRRYTFDATGLYPVKLYVQDIFGDTISSNIFMRVSSEPVCSKLNLEIFQGSPIFKWSCQNTDDSAELTYRFTFKVGRSKIDTLLKENSLQLGYSLPSDDWEAHLSVENSYGLKVKLDSIIFKAKKNSTETLL